MKEKCYIQQKRFHDKLNKKNMAKNRKVVNVRATAGMSWQTT